jgi:hypothetical protein
MSVNRNPTSSQKNIKKLPVSKYFSFIAGVVDTGDKNLYFGISPLLCIKRGEMINEKT